MSANGHTCINWVDVENYEITAELTVDDVTKAKNYCKKLADEDRQDPSCVILIDNKLQTEERCDIPFCGKSAALLSAIHRVHVTMQIILNNFAVSATNRIILKLFSPPGCYAAAAWRVKCSASVFFLFLAISVRLIIS